MIRWTYALVIERDGEKNGAADTTAAFILKIALREAAENITDLLPDGYRAVITHWTGSEET